jgi:flagellar biosynthetic protein FliP
MKSGKKKTFLVISCIAVGMLLTYYCQNAFAKPFSLPNINVSIGESSGSGEMVVTMKILLLLTILSLAPSIIIMLTSFARIVVVLGFLRQAMGTQQMPPNHILIGLSLFLTFFIMTPVWQKINTQALQPYMSQQISQGEAWDLAVQPLRDFMLKQTREKDLALFLDITKQPKPKNVSEISIFTVIPAFIVSELKTAFQIGFMIFIPFLILDMIVASVLLSMGMMMLPPIMISLPFKLMLFVLVDGWDLIIGSLVKSFT